MIAVTKHTTIPVEGSTVLKDQLVGKVEGLLKTAFCSSFSLCRTLYAEAWRFDSCCNGSNCYWKISPLRVWNLPALPWQMLSRIFFG